MKLPFPIQRLYELMLSNHTQVVRIDQNDSRITIKVAGLSHGSFNFDTSQGKLSLNYIGIHVEKPVEYITIDVVL